MTRRGARGRISTGGILLQLLPAALLSLLFAAVGVVHVSSRVLVVHAGYRVSLLETEARALARENDRLKLELATLRSPARLERIAREKLGLVPPPAGSVISTRHSTVVLGELQQPQPASRDASAITVRVAHRGNR